MIYTFDASRRTHHRSILVGAQEVYFHNVKNDKGVVDDYIVSGDL